MADILLYIRWEQVERVFRDGSIGSGSTAFLGMIKDGGRVFVASKPKQGLAVVGEIPIDERDDKPEYPHGWRYRVRATTHDPNSYHIPVLFEEIKDRLEFLRDAPSISRAIRRCRRLSPADAKLISTLGAHGPSEGTT